MLTLYLYPLLRENTLRSSPSVKTLNKNISNLLARGMNFVGYIEYAVDIAFKYQENVSSSFTASRQNID